MSSEFETEDKQPIVVDVNLNTSGRSVVLLGLVPNVARKSTRS